jgi:formate dehydrogenase beta subunit
VLGGGNTAMDCCRSARRLGGEDVKVVVRSGFEEMKASPWEKEDAMHEGIPIHNFLVPKEFTHKDGKLTGMVFEKVQGRERRQGPPQAGADRRAGCDIFECDDVLVAVGQENAFPWIERDIGIDFDKWDMPVVDERPSSSTHPKVFFGGDAAFGPKNIIWAVAHGHEAAVSIDKVLNGEDPAQRPLPATTLISQKMGIHEWSYNNEVVLDERYKVPHAKNAVALARHQGRGRTRLRRASWRFAEGASLPELRRADRVHAAALHRMRCLRRHLPDGLHHLHAER